MDSMLAFANAQMAHGRLGRVFDWRKAARLIKEHKPTRASAGLQSDWEWTGGTIYENGKPDIESYTYLGSTWAIPELEMDGHVQECFIDLDKDEPNPENWDCHTKWPQSALDLLK